jgi:copper chaperone
MVTTILHVPAIACEHCARTITQALGRIPGVAQVDVDIPAKDVRVAYDETIVDPERLKRVLEAEDYPVASVRS